MKKAIVLIGLGLLINLAGIPAGTAQDDAATPLTLLIHPTYVPDQAVAVHQPLVQYLSESLGRTVEMVTPRDFHKYWRDTRNEVHYDMVLEDSHIADYRRLAGTHTPLVKASENVTFMLLSFNPDLRDPEQLIGQRVITMSSPSMGYQLLSTWFSNPMAQPQIMSNSKSWLDGVEMVFAAEADAAVAPHWLARRYPNLTPIAKSEPIPGLTLSISNRVDVTIRDRVLSAMVALDENSEAYVVLDELDVDRFVAANPSDYAGLSELLNNLYNF